MCPSTFLIVVMNCLTNMIVYRCGLFYLEICGLYPDIYMTRVYMTYMTSVLRIDISFVLRINI